MTASSTDGMRDVVAAQSEITYVDGKKGELRYRGYSISELASGFNFEEIAYLLWHGDLPSSSQLARQNELARSLRAARKDLLDRVEDIPLSAHPLEVMRYVLCWDALGHPLAWKNDPEANYAKALEFMAWFPSVVTAFHRRRSGLRPIVPRPDLDTAANFLYMLHGQEADAVAVRTMDTSFVLHADHELNASTFAARVTIATQSNLHSAIASALGTLAGPRHGGASEQVVHMVQEIGSPENTERWVRGQLQERRRIMGFGHAVYRTVDPRARHLRDMAEKLLQDTPRESWISILSALEDVMQREKGLYPNVDLYAAVVHHALGIEPAFYTSVFACSRITGWTAHSMEQRDGRLIRPMAQYVGPQPRSTLVGSAR
ncbi:MAG TPA: citrate/2-methylcitrate synthase [Chloroflexota bacterium]